MSIFRAYDIRGIYGKDLTDEIAKKIGKAVGSYIHGNVTIGRDFGEHNTRLEKAFMSGLVETGSNAYLVGTCPIGLCIFSNWKMNNDLAVYITASHLPSQWSGVKLFHRDGVGFSLGEIAKLRELYASHNFKTGEGLVKDAVTMEEEYINFIVDRMKPEGIKVVVDFGGGATCQLAPKVLEKLDIEASFIHDEPDPMLQRRDPEPRPDSLTDLCRKVVEEKADLGIAFDNDGDRALYVDDNGQVIMTEHIAILFLKELMKTRRGPVVVNMECSDLIKDEIKKYGMTVFRVRVGYSFMIQETKRRNAILGVEKSGHICIPRFYWFDDAIINSIYMMEIVSKIDRISEVLRDMPVEFSKRIEIDVDDEVKFETMDKIRKKAIETYENVDTTDGVKIEFPDSWALIRASNTSPRIRVLMETTNEKRLNELRREVTALLSNVLGRALE